MIANEESELNRTLSGFWYWVLVGVALVVIALGLNHIYNFRFFMDVSLLEPSYLYLLVGLLLGTAFIAFPANAKAAHKVQWYDVALAVFAMASCSFFAFYAPNILAQGWEFKAPMWAVGLALALIAMLLEAVRRTIGLTFTIVVIISATYPMWAGLEFLPIKGFFLSWEDTVRFHMFSIQSIFGVTTQVVGSLLIGFIVFGITLYSTGAGTFFVNVAMALMGNVRGGTAKVAIVASGLFGMMSGSAVSNVLSTGTITIPAMKRTGFSPSMAAAIEANAASHGAMTPPVMGATAFIMASLLQIPYVTIAVAAAVPAFLFYYGMFCQIDGYSARNGLRGLPREELPSLVKTLKEGWIYIFAIAELIALLLWLHLEAHAPWYTALTLLVLSNLRPETRWKWQQVAEYFYTIGRLLSALVPLLAAVGMLVGALYVTGTAGSLTSDLVHLAGNNVAVLLVLGSLASFILGTGLPGTAAYIFLAIMMAPVLIQQGLNPLAVHLFLLYWANLADVTPPTAVSVVAASAVANSPIMRTMWEATRVAAIKYVEPFMFVIAPARILQTDNPVEFLSIFVTALIGIALVGYAMQGYLPWVGCLRSSKTLWAMQGVLILGGFCIAYPDALITAIGVAVSAPIYGFLWFARKRNWDTFVIDMPAMFVAPALPTPVARPG